MGPGGRHRTVVGFTRRSARHSGDRGRRWRDASVGSRLDTPAWEPVPGGDVNLPIVPPVIWSPDSGSLIVMGSRGLKKVSLSGGAPQTICAGITHAVGGDWNQNDLLLLGNGFGGVLRFSCFGWACHAPPGR